MNLGVLQACVRAWRTQAADTDTLLPGAGLFNPQIRAANTNAPAVHSNTFRSAATLASDVCRLPCHLNFIVSTREVVVCVHIGEGYMTSSEHT